MIDWFKALGAGACGAVALTAVHQLAQQVSDTAPRMDVLGERAIQKVVDASGTEPSPEPAYHRVALGGDLVANSVYYSLVACGTRSGLWQRGVMYGLAAGVGALVLPRRMGLGEPPNSHRLQTQVMTVAWYLIGGLTAAAVASAQGGNLSRA